jgi:hypothetical protein
MYGIFTYIWVIYGVNVDKYSIHGASHKKKQTYFIISPEVLLPRGSVSTPCTWDTFARTSLFSDFSETQEAGGSAKCTVGTLCDLGVLTSGL